MLGATAFLLGIFGLGVAGASSYGSGSYCRRMARLSAIDEANHNYNDDRQSELRRLDWMKLGNLYSQKVLKIEPKDFKDPDFFNYVTPETIAEERFGEKRHAIAGQYVMIKAIMEAEGFTYRPYEDKWESKEYAKHTKGHVHDYTGSVYEGL